MEHTWNAAGVVAFYDEKIALVYLKELKGWDIIFGKVEPGEAPEDTIRREAYEEGGIILADDVKRIYSFADSHGDNIVFAGDIREIRSIPAGFESTEMRLYIPSQAIALSSEYMPVNRLLILAALESRRMMKERKEEPNEFA